MDTIEYFYSAHSAYAYLGHRKLIEICACRGARLVHRPFDLTPVIASGRVAHFRGFTPHYIDYFFGREIERWAQYRRLDILNHRPTHHGNALSLSNGFLIAAARAGHDVDALSFAILQAHWRDDIDLADPEHLRNAITPIDPECDALLRQAMDTEIQTIHAENTEEAIARGIFGSPTYFLNGDMYYGQDHLELMDHAFERPYRDTGFYNPPRHR